MAKKKSNRDTTSPLEDEAERPKFSQFLTSPIVAVTVGKSRTFNLHLNLLVAESEKYCRSLKGAFREAKEHIVDEVDEDPELYGFFVEYLYRDRSVLSQKVQRYTELGTLARLYALGERLMAPAFQAQCLWRFTESIGNPASSEESLCNLLEIACTELSERVREDPMRSHIFWYAGTQITILQKSSIFRQLLHELPDLGRHICLWVNQSQPPKARMPNELDLQKFGPESEFNPKGTAETAPEEQKVENQQTPTTTATT